MTDTPPETAKHRRAALVALLSEIRVIIGGLFCVYGLIVAGAGLFDSKAELDKAQGVNINLWTGLAMLVFGAAFLLWAYLRPVRRSGDET
ncbi:hypothetical protein [Actinomadura sp. HBU206391]|uniref:hypothetical protein n=1 Tax=Actinomadura sp. HBU206391 TaxID=2731692 RepID=UPI00164FD5C8|nr:hypothetical protein [Actinomadura sp. HBU206391]MBC6462597.1 hypothetical protein [Actinomadura sp. HBU206391]